MNCHANGDVAIDHVLTAYERALHQMPVGPTHAQRSRTARSSPMKLVRRIKALGVVLALLPPYAYYNPDGSYRMEKT